MKKFLLVVSFFTIYATAEGALAGGRLNAFSEGQNAFAGVVNPANAVWIPDRLDVGAFLVHQKSSLTNHDDNPLFPSGKIDLTHHVTKILTADAAIHKRLKLKFGSKTFESSFSLAAYTLPSYVKLRTNKPIPIAGTTPIKIVDKTDVISTVFSFKLNTCHSIGFTIDYFYFSHLRNGFQNSDNPLRSVSPGHVTNNGTDHSSGIGLTVGWRYRITERLDFGAAWARKSYCGQYRKYRGYEPFHAENYTPQMIGAGLTYRFSSRIAGRVEMLWMDLGNLPNANNNVLSDGTLNLHKRGSDKSPGPGLNDATFINLGVGYKVNSMLSVGLGYSHRIKLPRKTSNFISHTYRLQTIYDILSFGVDFNYKKQTLFLGVSYGFTNKVSGIMPIEAGGGRFSAEKRFSSLSISWGYIF